MKNRRWTINIFVELVDAEARIKLQAEATNLADALIAAITQARQRITADAVTSIHISAPHEADSDDTTQMPVAWIEEQ